MPTIDNIIDYVDLFKPNSYTDAQKISWMNRVEQDVKKNIMKTFIKSDVQRIINVAEYSLPAGVVFNDIELVFINKYEVPKIDERAYIDGTIGNYGYYKSSTKIGIVPTPIKTDDVATPGLRIVYLENFTALTTVSGELMIPDQHRDVYEYYMMAQIEWFNKEYEAYNNTIIRYNACWDDFATWYSKRQAVDQSLKIKNLL